MIISDAKQFKFFKDCMVDRVKSLSEIYIYVANGCFFDFSLSLSKITKFIK